ncbi:hypothetical protein M747DRAFT_368651 [Aspergillus niger ATCC 13496]|uniref:Serine hydrolase domain-containing protein n=1 Tax=Aspergillus niger ATCC 13496 TaxID=1353008 RepID=A0A370C9M7_ASPNG|nr:hypothetical protein M747DRAFT_368651 [Aspergillus niger ATCC 13496]
MRIICLHGNGTNSAVMKLQTAPLIHELEDDHEFEFVEGTLQAPMAEGIESLATPADQAFYAFYNPDDPATLLVALDQLSSYVDDQGPFDGVVAFSAGAVLVGLYLLQLWQQGKPLPFRFAVFFSTASSGAELAQLSLAPTPGCLKLPTAHIWGQNDLIAPTGGANMASLCDPSQTFVSVHEGGHEFPRQSKLTEAVHMMRRAIGRASS